MSVVKSIQLSSQSPHIKYLAHFVSRPWKLGAPDLEHAQHNHPYTRLVPGNKEIENDCQKSKWKKAI